MTITQAEVCKVIQRYADGSIDVDFYKAQIEARRPQAVQDGLKSKGTLASGLVTAAALGLIAILASASWQSVADSAPRYAVNDASSGARAE